MKLPEWFYILQGFRKTTVMLLVLVLAVVARWLGWISGDNLTDLVRSTAIAFFGTNAWEHATSTAKQYIESRSASSRIPVDNPDALGGVANDR